MPAAYLTPTEAVTRLSNYRITAPPNEMELQLASDEIDQRGGWIGLPYDSAQLRAFPRNVTVQDDVAGATPSRVLDWVALRAYQLSEDDEPDVASEKVDTISQSYAKPKKSRVSRLMKPLLKPYRYAGSVRIT